MTDWTGNKRSIFGTLGASSHTDKERANQDFYATDPIAIDILCSVEKFNGDIWECACGNCILSNRLQYHGYNVISTDIVDRGCGTPGINFLYQHKTLAPNIITNPPYKFATEFVCKAMELLPQEGKLALFLKLQFLEGKQRKQLFEQYPPRVVYVSSSRINCARNGNFNTEESSAVAYAWFLWDKNYSGNTIVKWVN